MYIPGRLRTASRPSITVMSSALYSDEPVCPFPFVAMVVSVVIVLQAESPVGAYRRCLTHHTIYDQELRMDWASLAYARARVFKKRGFSSLQSYQPTPHKSRFRLHSNPNLSQFNPSNKPDARISAFATRVGLNFADEILSGTTAFAVDIGIGPDACDSNDPTAH